MQFYLVDAFTDTPFRGNPAGVFFEEERGLSDEQRMRLCAEFSLESAFVLPGDAHCDLNLQYYTAAMEVPFCGHATVAAMTALASAGRIGGEGTYRIGTKAGIVPVTLEQLRGNTTVTLQHRPGEFIKELSSAETLEVMRALVLDITAISRHKPAVVFTGSPWLLLLVRDPAAADGIDPKFCAEAICELSRRHDVLGVYVFAVHHRSPRRQGDEAQIWGRCFAPIADLPEDPVTGSALACVGCFLAKNRYFTTRTSAVSFTAIQGFAGKRWGTAYIRVVLAGKDQWQASVAGTAVVIAQGTVLTDGV